MNRLEESTAQRSVRCRTLAFCICFTVMLTISAPGFCQGQETNTRLDASEKAAMREMREIAAVAANLLNVYMDARVTDTLLCSTTCERLREALTTPDAQVGANQALEEWLKISGACDAVLLLDKSGVCVASAPASLVTRNFSDDKAFQGAIKGKLTISDLHKSEVVSSLDPKSKGWTLTIAAPIKVGNDVDGVLVSFVKWSRLVELVASIRKGASGYVFVLDRENRVIIHPAAHLYGIGLRDPQVNLPELDEAVKKKVTNHSYEYINSMTRLVDSKIVGFAYPAGYGNFPGLGWTVGTGVDRSEALYTNSILLSLLRSLGLLKE